MSGDLARLIAFQHRLDRLHDHAQRDTTRAAFVERTNPRADRDTQAITPGNHDRQVGTTVFETVLRIINVGLAVPLAPRGTRTRGRFQSHVRATDKQICHRASFGDRQFHNGAIGVDQFDKTLSAFRAIADTEPHHHFTNDTDEHDLGDFCHQRRTLVCPAAEVDHISCRMLYAPRRA